MFAVSVAAPVPPLATGSVPVTLVARLTIGSVVAATTFVPSLKTNFFEPLIAVFVDHPDTWTTASWAWAAALFVVFLLMILCICSSFWPEKQKKPRKRGQRYAV